MVKVLEESEIDPITEQVDMTLTLEEERIAAEMRRFDPTQTAPDLSDGGVLNRARLRTMQADGTLARRGQPSKGRPAARRAWMWNGTESLLPLAWNPDGNVHDSAARYLRKRFCICCKRGGFYGRQCPNCVKSNCEQCQASTEPKKVIACFYLRKQDVPFPSRFYGSINCFLEFCVRRESRGFLTEQDMRMHARSRHRMEYQAYQETLAASRTDELESLRRKLDSLLSSQVSTKVKAARRKKAETITKPAMA